MNTYKSIIENVNKGASADLVSSFEKLYNIKLPSDYVTLLNYSNGGDVNNELCAEGSYMSRLSVLRDDRCFEQGDWCSQVASIQDFIEYHDCYEDNAEDFTDEGDLSKLMVIADVDSGGMEYLCLDYRNSNTDPQVVNIDFMWSDITKISDSFSGLFSCW